MTIPFLPAGSLNFPDPRPALSDPERGGLVCVSEGITPEQVLAAYRTGIFPWHSEDGYVFWFATAPRAVLYPERLHLPRSLRKTLRNTAYRVWVNRDFAAVIRACAEVPREGQDGSWIALEFQAAYTALHHAGFAHSFECYRPDGQGGEVLAGGLYGVQIGSVFFGESMFARQPDASKTAFACAVPYLAQCGVRLIDCQQDTAHLARFGSETLAFTDFQAALRQETVRPLCRVVARKAVVAENPVGKGAG